MGEECGTRIKRIGEEEEDHCRGGRTERNAHGNKKTPQLRFA